jgi:fatty acid desaturase
VVPVEKLSDDFLFGLDRTTLTDKWGASYGQLRKAPRWGIVWRDLTLGWIAFALIIIATIAASHRSPFLALVAGVVAAVLVGFTIAYFMLFLHEAAHCNIHPDRWWNDLLCNVFVSGIIGMDVQSYRQIHWDHHRYFGGPMDSEISYRDPLNLRFLVELLIGVRALKVVLMRGKKLRSTDAEKPKKTRLKTARSVLLGGMVFNGALLSVLFYFHEWAAMVGWIGGVLVFYPFFGALRQLLEHRGELPVPAEAKIPAKERIEVVCYATNRLFGDGVLASTFGAAGFNRHLLHHWDPQISYTRLRELENFLLDTEAAPYLRERQTTYWRTVKHLFSFSRR